jgi:hypothetical protein
MGAAAGAVSAALAPLGQAAEEQYAATAVGIGGSLGGVSRPITIRISHYSSDADIKRYLEALKSKGQDGLEKAVHNEDVGRINVEGYVGVRMNVARSRPSETGRQIRCLFERDIKMYELRSGTRSVDYPFGYVEMNVDETGKGEGTLISAARIRIDKQGNVEIENFGTYPARLMGVRRM